MSLVHDVPTRKASAPAAFPTPESAPPPAVSALTRDFLRWLTEAPRTYADTMEAWRSHCPRLTIWEDALGGGLIAVVNRGGRRTGEAEVTLTPAGWNALGVAEPAVAQP